MNNADHITGIIVMAAFALSVLLLVGHEIKNRLDANRRRTWVQTILAGPEATAALASVDRRFAAMLAAAEANSKNVGPNRVW